MSYVGQHLPSVTFHPLSRNRYRVIYRGGGKGPIIKQARTQDYLRQHENSLRSKGPKRIILKRAQIASGFWKTVQCPECNYRMDGARPGEMGCTRCGKGFIAHY